MTVRERIEDVFAEAGATGFLHARPVGGGPEVSVGADEPVVIASVFKIAVAVAYAREVAAGRLDDRAAVTVPARYRVGGSGTAGCADDVRMSWRDLAVFMLSMSDNAATDVVYHRVGGAAVQAVLDDLGLTRTRLVGCCEDLAASVIADLGLDPGAADLEERLAAQPPERVWELSILDPARTSASTPREITALLDAVWTDRAGDPRACALTRELLGRQVWSHRLASGFGSGVRVAAKTGTVPAIRNEAGVVAYPDGARYAVAVFTRARTLAERAPAVDLAIGRAARLAVDHLRGE